MMLLIGRYRPSSSLWAGRSFAGEIALVSRSSSHQRSDAFPMLPTSTTTRSRRPRPSSVVDVLWEGPVGSSRRLYRPGTPRSSHSSIEPDRHWCRSSDVEPRRRPSELAEPPRLLEYIPDPPPAFPLFGTARKPRLLTSFQ